MKCQQSVRRLNVESLEQRQFLTVTLLEDFNNTPHGISASQFNVGKLGDEVYFVRADAQSGEQLWKSNGQKTQKVANLESQNNSAEGVLQFLTNDDRLYFILGSIGENELWVTDGMTTTRLWSNLGMPEDIGHMTVFGNKLAFTVEGLETNVWTTDGTIEGTGMLPGQGFDFVPGIAAFNNEILVSVVSDAPDFDQLGSLWKSDGISGVELVQDFGGDGYDRVDTWLQVGDDWWFTLTSNVPSLNSTELWKMDGQTGERSKIFGDGFWISLHHATEQNGVVFFDTSVPDGLGNLNSVWRSDGTTAGTRKLEVGVEDVELITQLNENESLFLSKNELVIYRSDGTAKGTKQVYDLAHTAFGRRFPIVVVGDNLYFTDQSITNETTSSELTRYDTSTEEITSIARFDDWISTELTRFGDQFVFVAQDPTLGKELFVSDGTAEGTRVAADLFVGTRGTDFTATASTDDKLIFATRESFAWHKIWARDADGNTEQLGELMAERVRMNSTGEQVFIHTEGASHDFRLMVTDGTKSGSATIFTNNNTDFEGEGFGAAAIAGEKLVLPYWFKETGVELLVSDGTEQGTGLLKDIISGDLASFPNQLTAVGDLVYFAANSNLENGLVPGNRELWRTDGTAEGTYQVIDIDPDTPGHTLLDTDGSFPEHITPVDDTTFYFLAEIDEAKGIWKSDGTAAGTTRVVELHLRDTVIDLTQVGDTLFFLTGSPRNEAGEQVYRLLAVKENSIPVELLAGQDAQFGGLVQSWGTEGLDGKFYFTATTAEGNTSLWQSDGTAVGTTQVRDFGIGMASGDLREVSGLLYFTVETESFGRGLWASDGTAIGTRRYDIAIGNDSSDPRFFAEWNDELYFAANDAVHGRELWRAIPQLPLAGDLDEDGDVDFEDFLSLSGNFGASNLYRRDGDLDGDGEVTFDDFLLLSKNFGLIGPKGVVRS